MKVVTREVAKKFGFTEEQILGRQKWHPLGTARHLAMMISVESQPDKRMVAIAKYFKRDHSTLVHARKAILRYSATEPKLRRLVDFFRRKFVKDLTPRPRGRKK